MTRDRTASTARPRVICHMATSIDGRIIVDGWPAAASAPRLVLDQVERRADDGLWLRYRVEATATDRRA